MSGFVLLQRTLLAVMCARQPTRRIVTIGKNARFVLKKYATCQKGIENEKRKTHSLILRGTKYIFNDGKSEIIRALYEDAVFVNPLKDYSHVYSDIVIAVPFLHADINEFIKSSLVSTS